MAACVTAVTKTIFGDNPSNSGSLVVWAYTYTLNSLNNDKAMVWVFPVPGGPQMTLRRFDIMCRAARFCEAFNTSGFAASTSRLLNVRNSFCGFVEHLPRWKAHTVSIERFRIPNNLYVWDRSALKRVLEIKLKEGSEDLVDIDIQVNQARGNAILVTVRELDTYLQRDFGSWSINWNISYVCKQEFFLDNRMLRVPSRFGISVQRKYQPDTSRSSNKASTGIWASDSISSQSRSSTRR